MFLKSEHRLVFFGLVAVAKSESLDRYTNSDR